MSNSKELFTLNIEDLWEIIQDLTGCTPSEEEIKEAVDRRIEDLKWEEKSWAGANGMEYHDSPSLQDNAHYGAMIDMQNHELGGKR